MAGRDGAVKLVVALGGNALLRRGEPPELDVQRANVEAAARSIAALARHHHVVVTHGNGPQVGLLALQAAVYRAVRPYTLDVLVAESQGMIGYLVTQALERRLPEQPVATLLTQVVVDPDDPAFAHPTKPIGPAYPKAEARRLADERGWTVVLDGTGYRRVVASPEPRQIVELEAIRRLVERDVLTICVGGGGIPVTAVDGLLQGIEAVIDKDLASSLLAAQLQVDMLLILTDVPKVERDWGSPSASPIDRASPAELRTLSFAPGSMGPKVEAACRFVERTQRPAAIGAVEESEEIVRGLRGTHVVPEATASSTRRAAA
jgi:carbamate kinase